MTLFLFLQVATKDTHTVATRWRPDVPGRHGIGEAGAVKLTQAIVAKMQPGAKRSTAYDDALPGFGLRIYPTGKRAWIVEYRPAGAGRGATKRRVTLGNPDVLPLDKARAEARKLLAQVTTGGDPARERRAERDAATVASVAEAFLAEHVRPKLKPRTAGEYERILKRDVLPEIGRLKLKDLKRRDVARLHDKLSRAAPLQANKALAVISALWGWAARRDDEVAIEANPARGVERHREQGRERFLTDDELSRLGEALRLAESTGLPWEVKPGPKSKHMPKPENRVTRASPYVTAALRLLILTGARLREVLHLRWEEVDFQRGMAFLPDSKTGRKPLILSGAALQLLQALPRDAQNPHVIPGANGGPRADLKAPWKAIVRHAKLDGLRLHDLRHSSASIMAGAGASLPVIGRVLGGGDN